MDAATISAIAELVDAIPDGPYIVVKSPFPALEQIGGGNINLGSTFGDINLPFGEDAIDVHTEQTDDNSTTVGDINLGNATGADVDVDTPATDGTGESTGATTADAGTQTDAPADTAEVGTQTDAPAETAEVGTQTDAPAETADAGTQTEGPAETAEVGTQTDAPAETADAGTQTEVPAGDPAATLIAAAAEAIR